MVKIKFPKKFFFLILVFSCKLNAPDSSFDRDLERAIQLSLEENISQPQVDENDFELKQALALSQSEYNQTQNQPNLEQKITEELAKAYARRLKAAYLYNSWGDLIQSIFTFKTSDLKTEQLSIDASLNSINRLLANNKQALFELWQNEEERKELLEDLQSFGERIVGTESFAIISNKLEKLKPKLTEKLNLLRNQVDNLEANYWNYIKSWEVENKISPPDSNGNGICYFKLNQSKESLEEDVILKMLEEDAFGSPLSSDEQRLEIFASSEFGSRAFSISEKYKVDSPGFSSNQKLVDAFYTLFNLTRFIQDFDVE